MPLTVVYPLVAAVNNLATGTDGQRSMQNHTHRKMHLGMCVC